MATISCSEAKKTDIVQFLSGLGFEPKKIRGNDYWYCSPFRAEKEPSFKVNRKFNVWFDHGIQKGGNLLDFGIAYFNCSIAEFLRKISQQDGLSFHQQKPLNRSISYPEAGEKAKIHIMDIRKTIVSTPLQKYLSSRKIPLEIANRFCQEIDFQLYDRKYTAIGFQNRAGGYELRSAHFKGSSSPKEVTLLKGEHAKTILVFEGFFDFLSHQAIYCPKQALLSKKQSDFLVLNSIGFIERIKPLLENYTSVHLFLDRDSKGLAVTKELLAIGNKFRDESLLYKDHKDINDFLIKEHPELKQSRKKGLAP
jgi:hypothetical protein